jgi:hypothetical protein
VLGILATRTYIDLDLPDLVVLPAAPELTAITGAERQMGVAMTEDAEPHPQKKLGQLSPIASHCPSPATPPPATEGLSR